MNELTVGSLFAGIGGFDLGFERAGLRTVWFCEQDEFCRAVLAKHWPGVPCYPDVRALVADPESHSESQQPEGDHDGGSRLVGSGSGAGGGTSVGGTAAGDQFVGGDQVADGAGAMAGKHDGPVPVPVPYVDVLCGGFPCQDLSLAGKGAGIDGQRSGLWGEYARLIRELRPRYVVVENVAALLGRGLGRVLGDLAACGYDAEWDCISASAVGAPHRRDRLWIVAYPGGEPGGLGEHRGGGSGREPADARKPALVRQEDGQGGAEGLAPRRAVAVDGEARPVAHPDGERGNGAGERGRGRRQPTDGSGPGGVGYTDGAPEDPHAAPSGSWPAAGERGWWLVEPAVGRVADGVPNRVDRLAALGNALVPQIAEWLGRRIIEAEEQLT